MPHLSNKTVDIISLGCLTFSNVALAILAVIFTIKAYHIGWDNLTWQAILPIIGCLAGQQVVSQMGHNLCVDIDQHGW